MALYCTLMGHFRGIRDRRPTLSACRLLPSFIFAMASRQASERWRLGLSLSMSTALLWATLPVALKLSLEQLDPITLT